MSFRRSGRVSTSARQVPWLLAFPAVFFVVAFQFAPIGSGIYHAFTSWNGVGDASWVGLRNFREIFSDATTSDALVHTLQLGGLFVVAVNAFGLALALALNKAIKSRNILRAIFFAPAVISPLAVAYIFQFAFDQNGGLNRLLATIGLGSLGHPWLADPSTALWMVLVVLVWQYSGLAMIIYLAGLQGIPDELHEAAAVDGATSWMRLRRITLPLLLPALTVNVTLAMIFGLRVFDQIIALTGGGPVNATETLATQVFVQTFTNGRFGYGAALALILTILIAAVSVTQMFVMRLHERRL